MELYRAKWLLPVSTAPIEDGVLGVERGNIVFVGRAADAPAGAAHDLGESILLPGFVNSHTHLELSAFHQRLAPSSLWDWFDGLWRLICEVDFDVVGREAVARGAEASLRSGVTCIGDISRTGLNISILRDSPIRKVCFLELISGARLPPNDPATLAAAVEEASRLAEPERLMIGVSPHAPYTVTEADLPAAGRLAWEKGLPLAMHFLETRDEREWMEQNRGRTADFISSRRLPTARVGGIGGVGRFLDQAGLNRGARTLVHCNYARADELRPPGLSVIYCPRTHRFFGHEPHPWQSMLAAGINVCVGTDSLASVDTLSMLDELRFLHSTWSDVPPELLLEMGTIRGARALGLGRRLGSLEAGKCADFVCAPLNVARCADPIQALLSGEANPARVWIAGEQVIDSAC